MPPVAEAVPFESGNTTKSNIVSNAGDGNDDRLILEPTLHSGYERPLSNTANQTLVVTPPLDQDNASTSSDSCSMARWYFLPSKNRGLGMETGTETGDENLEAVGTTNALDATLDLHTDGCDLSARAMVELTCTKIESPPVTIDIQMRRSAKWDIPRPSREQGPLESVLGFSFEDLDVDKVYQLLFRIETEEPYTEVVTRKTLKNLVRDNVDIIRLKMHATMDFAAAQSDPSSISVVVEVVMLKQAANPSGRFLLHYAEYHEVNTVDWTLDSSVRVHKPYIWSLNVDRSLGMRIRTFATSGDGQRIVTLSDRVESGTLHSLLELWDVSSIRDYSPGDQSSFSTPPRNLEAMASLTLAPSFAYNKYKHHLSLSFDGSQISISSLISEESLAIYLYRQRNRHLQLTNNHKIFPNYNETGEFSNTTTIFVSVGDYCATVCNASALEPWRPLRTIPIGRFWRLIDYEVHDRYIAFLFSHRLMIWNMERGRLVSFLETTSVATDRVSFTGDHSLAVVTEVGALKSVFTDTGTVLSSAILVESLRKVPQGQGEFVVIPQIQDGGHVRYGAVLTRTDLAERFKFAALPNLTLLSKQSSSSEDLQALVFQGFTLDLVQLKSRATNFVDECDNSCASHLRAPIPDTRSSLLMNETVVDVAGNILLLTVSGVTGTSTLYNIPLPRTLSLASTATKILLTSSKMILDTGDNVMVWSLPATIDKPPALDMVWCKKWYYSRDIVVKECEHGAIHLQDKNSGTGTESLGSMIKIEPGRKVLGLLSEMYSISESWCKGDIIRYLGRYLNAKRCVVAKLCEAWCHEERVQFERLFRSLLDHSPTP
ncbi:hypothetical protein EDD21DRAFT_96980 [Dissophora ornata]|nr:hypothetical protein EDD21DRAFT_96980 [Dissophora ornata]